MFSRHFSFSGKFLTTIKKKEKKKKKKKEKTRKQK
jgi:hypothetical protein